MLSVIVWDPPKAVLPWNIPLIDRPILWYGLFFALGFFLAYHLLVYLLTSYFEKGSKSKGAKKTKSLSCKMAKELSEKALVYSVIGTVFGARIGDVVIYQSWSQIMQDPLSVIKVWEGGLASHGGAVGALIAFWCFYVRFVRKVHKDLSFLRLLDLFCLPISLAAGFIRLGNFFNQEILGVKAQVPWAVVFLHPADGSIPTPRHPAQLYEAICYFVVGFVLFRFWRQGALLKKNGCIFGLFLFFVFGARFLIESVKEEQSVGLLLPWMNMGQWLSIPFVIMGVILVWKSLKRR